VRFGPPKRHSHSGYIKPVTSHRQSMVDATSTSIDGNIFIFIIFIFIYYSF